MSLGTAILCGLCVVALVGIAACLVFARRADQLMNDLRALDEMQRSHS